MKLLKNMVIKAKLTALVLVLAAQHIPLRAEENRTNRLKNIRSNFGGI